MRSVAFLICPEFSNFGLAAATEPLFVANWLAQAPLFDWKIISRDGQSVRASNGRIMAVDGGLDLGSGCQSVFVLASFDTHAVVRDRRVIGWLKRLQQHGAEIGGIENGSNLMAEAGLLNGRRVAVHWDNIIGFSERFPETEPIPELYTRSGRLMTCAGAAAVLDLMIAWIGWHNTTAIAEEVAEHLLVGLARPAATAQRPPRSPAPGPADAMIERTKAIMSEHVEEPLTCAQLARCTGLSLRQLERRFRAGAGSSVLRQYLLIRIAKAHQLLQQTPLPVTEVALACGFSSPEYFCRLYRSMLGCSPSADRRQSTTAPVLRQRI